MIIITGASDGLGKQVAKLYKEAGKKVVNISRRESEYADINICVSLREGEEIKKASDEILKMNEPIESIINCAGVLSVQKLGEITEDEIKRLMSTNVKSQILLISNLYKKIIEDKTDIVNVASTIGLKAYVDQAVYGASKWAVRGFTKNLQEEFKGKPNRIISFCPGGFKTKLFEKATGIDNTEKGDEWMKPEDLAVLLKQILDLPKNMEVSEIVINRK
ncbi:MAG: SDR family NAD(P)-dependent oxidoreductase [Candidatus Paceibacterota bacterium]